MNAIRQIIDVKNHSFHVMLPEDFNHQRVEVIILPSEQDDEIPQWQIEGTRRRTEEYNINPSIGIDYHKAIQDLKNEFL